MLNRGEFMNKLVDRFFIVIFFCLLLLPTLFFYHEEDAISIAENRKLTEFPTKDSLAINDINDWTEAYQRWFNDRIGFREQMISIKSLLDFTLFEKINTNDMYIGRSGSLIYATNSIITSYQQKNLPTTKELNDFSNSFATLQNYITSKGIQFYYAPCYDKQIIYPEEFLGNIYQYGEKSRREILIEELLKNRSLNIIDFKDELLEGKKQGRVYGDWSDPTHWNNRGAYIGYLEIMKELVKNNEQDIPILQEKDYDLSLVKKGYNLNNFYYHEDNIEKFDILNPKAEEVSKEILGDLSSDHRHLVYENQQVNNDLTLLVIGDSYIQNFLLDDLAESFSTTALVWAEYLDLLHLDSLVESINPDIILLEDAQRASRENEIKTIAKQINNKLQKG